MDRSLWEEGFEGVEIHYVGGLTLLLKFKEHEEATGFLLNQDLWKKRVAWLNVFRVPLHLADNSVLNNIAKEFGVIVQPAQLFIDDGDLSTTFVGILVGDGKVINDVWVPDCMRVVGLKEDDRVEKPRSPSPEEFSMEFEKAT
ncbi:hypothetical protein Hanom_Chr00s000003g01602471 [Helianthus anomalus]